MERRGWTKPELLETLQLYCITPFGRIHSRNPQIKDLATRIGRTASAVALKLTNFASLDPTLAQRGMSNASRLDREVWDDFFAQMSASLTTSAPAWGGAFTESPKDFAAEVKQFPDGADIVRSAKARVNQDFFRRLVLTSYDNKCALTGIDAPGLLVASHIVPWSQNKDIRTTPRNGICLNALHDCAFDQGFLTFADDFTVLYSSALPSVARDVLESLGSHRLRLPSRFVPDTSLIAFHRENIFRGDRPPD